MIFDFRKSDNGRSHGQFVGAEFAEYAGHVVQFGLVFHFSPFVAAVGQKLVVVFAGIVNGVEQVFQVIERHPVKCKTFLLHFVQRLGSDGCRCCVSCTQRK